MRYKLTDFEIKAEELAVQLGARIFGDGSTPVSDITHDSRQAGSGTIFVAIRGLTVDGHRFIGDVMRRDSAGVISELDPPDNFSGLWLKVSDARKALAKAASIVQQNPSHELDLVGITGTNGKTTTTYLILALIEASENMPAMLTTVEYRIGKNSQPAVRTTPEASDTQRFLRNAITEGCRFAVMETSSQAIHLRRCDWLRFKVAIFTNLTRDHLDYHHTMENYFNAKKELFDGSLGEPPRSSVVNIDDKWGVRLVKELAGNGQRVVTFAQKGPADLTAEDVNVSLIEGTSFRIKTPVGERDITSPLVGIPHVYNMLSAAAAGIELGFDLDDIQKGLEKCVGAPGRFERVRHDGDFAVIVDYAHSDDALLNTLVTARELTNGRIITVFGCGGDRDKTKRKPMGEVAGANSDLVIITSDNPRTEDPISIIEEIESGLKPTKCRYLINSDRREAIHQAISLAKPGDVVLIAGKGHETYQIIGADKFHFDDREIAREGLENLEV